MGYTYEGFIKALDTINKELKKSLKFKQLAKTIFTDTDKDNVVINVNGTSYYGFSNKPKITLNLKPDGSLFFETNIDKDFYYGEIANSSYTSNNKVIERLADCVTAPTCRVYTPIDSLVIAEYFSPKNIYYYFSHNIINELIGNDYERWNDLFDIRYDLRDLKSAKFLTYSKIKGTTDYKIKFKSSGNTYQLHYFTAPMARGFRGTEFITNELGSYSGQFDGDKALMLDAVLADIYNEAKLIRDEILPEIKFTKTQIIDHYKASQMTIERELTESFNAYVSDVTNPVGYYMLYNDGNWQVVRKGAYNSIENGHYSNHAYVKFDRFQNRLIELHLPDVNFDKALDYYINN